MRAEYASLLHAVSPLPQMPQYPLLGAYTLPLSQGQDIVVGVEGLMPEARDRLGREQGGFTELYSRIQDH
jgi:hypothetical protein